MGMIAIVLLFFIALIFLYFTYSYSRLSSEAEKIKSDVDIARQLIDSQDGSAESFYRDYEEINTNLSNTPSISHAWQEFTEHVTFDKNITGDHVVKNSIQPSSFFSMDNLLAKNTTIKRSHHVSWNLLGLGAVGAAIVFSVAMASMGSAPDHALALVKIAKYVSYAIVCLAMGLGFALFFFTIQKRELIHIEDKLHEFNTNLENVLIFSTSNQVLDEVLSALVEQNKKIDGISNNIALRNKNSAEKELVREKQNDELLQKLTDNFSGSLSQLFTEQSQLFTEQSQLFTEQSQQIDRTLDELKQHSSANADRFHDRLQQLFTEQSQQIDRTLDELKQHSSANADRFHDRLQQLFIHQSQHTTVALEKLKESNISNTDKLCDKLGDLYVSQEQFDYEIQATVKKQLREGLGHEDHENCVDENNDENNNEESAVEDNVTPLGRVS